MCAEDEWKVSWRPGVEGARVGPVLGQPQPWAMVGFRQDLHQMRLTACEVHMLTAGMFAL